MSKFAVLGPEGTYSAVAAGKLYPGVELEYVGDVEDVFKYVSEGRGDGVVAIENSMEGSVGKTMMGLLEYDVKITGEATLDIDLCLMAPEKVKKVDVIISHPHALGQCNKYLGKHHPKARRQGSSSTAEAMREVKGRRDAAAVGLKEAGLKYGLKVLAEGIQDTGSQTRFISISKKAVEGVKSSIIFAVKDEPGALYSILKVFADENINLTKIESRPSRKKLGEYLFYVDYENNGEDARLHDKIGERTTYFKYLGSY